MIFVVLIALSIFATSTVQAAKCPLPAKSADEITPMKPEMAKDCEGLTDQAALCGKCLMGITNTILDLYDEPELKTAMESMYVDGEWQVADLQDCAMAYSTALMAQPDQVLDPMQGAMILGCPPETMKENIAQIATERNLVPEGAGAEGDDAEDGDGAEDAGDDAGDDADGDDAGDDVGDDADGDDADGDDADGDDVGDDADGDDAGDDAEEDDDSGDR